MDAMQEQRLVKALRDTWSACASDLIPLGVDDTQPTEIFESIVDLIDVHGMKPSERKELLPLFDSLNDEEREKLAKLAFGGN